MTLSNLVKAVLAFSLLALLIGISYSYGQQPSYKVLYSSDETGDGELFVVYLNSNLDVMSKVNVTNRTSGEGYPRWSPNGDRIAFQSDYDGTGQLWVMNADGSGKRRVTDAALPVAPVSWSNDGLFIQAIMATPGDGEVVQVNVETGEITVLTDVPGYNTQHWDLNGGQTKIAYVRGYEGNGFSNQLYIADFVISGSDFTNIELLSAATPAPHSPRFSPSGTRIVFHLDNLSPWGEGIGIIDTDGSDFWTPIPVEGLVNQTPEWIDENRIIYAHGTDPGADLYILDLSDMSQKLITDAAGTQGWPDVFTYAQVLPAYKALYSSDETGDGEIFVLALNSNLDVMSKVNVTNRTSGEGYPRWSPNGDRIAFQSDYDGTGQLWVMNADGSGKRRVTDAALPVAPVSWSNDGLFIQAIMATPGDGEVVQVNVETGEITVLTDVPGYNTQHWDLNGGQTKIAYVRGYEGNGFSNQLYIADFVISGSDFTNIELLSAATPAPHSPRFSPSGTRIVFHLDNLSPWGEGIGIIDTDGSDFWTPIPVEGLVNQTPEWIDENRIIYAHGTDPGADLYILDLSDMSQKLITDAAGTQGWPDVLQVPYPDLIVSLSHSPENPTTADDIVFTAVVTNQGGAPAAASVLQIWVGGETVGSSYSIPALAPGASYVPTIPPVNLNTPGPYRATAMADYTGVVVEANELNNSGIDDFTVYVPAPPDLVVESLTLTPPYPTTADIIKFTAVVRNMGTGPAAASTLQIWVGGETEGTAHDIPALNPGESHEVTREASLSANAYRTTAHADYVGVVAESNEANNVNFVDFDVISADLVAHKLVYSSDETGDGEIFVIALNSNLDVLFKYNVTNRTSGEGYPRWSPNGDRIAFQSDYDGTGQLWVMNADGSGKRRVTDAALPVAPVSWSNDGLFIQAIMATPGDGEVVQVNVETGEITVLTDVPGYNTQHWDLNGGQTKIAYVRGYEGNGFSNQLYIADFVISGSDFTNIELLSAATPAPHSPRFSPSGTRIAFHLDNLSPWGEGIGIIDTDGSDFWTPIPVAGFVNQTPEWIDENRIIYAHGTYPGADLYILDLNSMSQKQITATEGTEGFPDIFSAAPPIPPGRKVDFNGDGQEDILWRYYGTGGYNRAWFLQNSELAGLPLSLASSQKATDAAGTAQSKKSTSNRMLSDPREMGIASDQKGKSAQTARKDGTSIMNSPDRRSAMVSDPRHAGGQYAKASPTMVADPRQVHLTLAGAPSLDASMKLASAPTFLGGADVMPVADLNWQIVGTGDFNKDGDIDILWRYNGSGGYNVVWFMNGTAWSSSAELLSVGDLNWKIVGTGDFDKDGNVDILWRNAATGSNVVWYMNGTQWTGSAVLLGVSDLTWQIVGTGDFNKDGNVDILWRYNGAGGYNVVWYLNNATWTGSAELISVGDLSWQIVGTGDYNNDGSVDLLWRYNGAGGYNVIWYMNGVNWVESAELIPVPDLNWKIVSR